MIIIASACISPVIAQQRIFGYSQFSFKVALQSSLPFAAIKTKNKNPKKTHHKSIAMRFLIPPISKKYMQH
jgi:hypothetical protein